LLANSPIEYVLFSFLQMNTTIKLHYPNASTSGRLHSKFVRHLFLQAHGEIDRRTYSF
jgi:hypothetical protein